MEGGLLSLVNAVEYNGYKIKEWNIVQFAKLSTTLTEIAKEYETQGVSYPDLDTLLGSVAQDGALGLSKAAMAFLNPILKRSEEILKISLGVPKEKLEEMGFTDGTILVLLIIKTNLVHLSSFFASLVGDSPRPEAV